MEHRSANPASTLMTLPAEVLHLIFEQLALDTIPNLANRMTALSVEEPSYSWYPEIPQVPRVVVFEDNPPASAVMLTCKTAFRVMALVLSQLRDVYFKIVPVGMLHRFDLDQKLSSSAQLSLPRRARSASDVRNVHLEWVPLPVSLEDVGMLPGGSTDWPPPPRAQYMDLIDIHNRLGRPTFSGVTTVHVTLRHGREDALPDARLVRFFKPSRLIVDATGTLLKTCMELFPALRSVRLKGALTEALIESLSEKLKGRGVAVKLRRGYSNEVEGKDGIVFWETVDIHVSPSTTSQGLDGR